MIPKISVAISSVIRRIRRSDFRGSPFQKRLGLLASLDWVMAASPWVSESRSSLIEHNSQNDYMIITSAEQVDEWQR